MNKKIDEKLLKRIKDRISLTPKVYIRMNKYYDFTEYVIGHNMLGGNFSPSDCFRFTKDECNYSVLNKKYLKWRNGIHNYNLLVDLTLEDVFCRKKKIRKILEKIK